MNEVMQVGGQADALTMSSLEIAELTGKRHGHVRRDIEQMLSGLEMDASNFGHIYRDAINRSQKEYLLPKDLTLTLVTGYDVKRRHAINVRWLELESGKALPAAMQPAMIENISGAVMKRIGGMVKSIIHKELGLALTEAMPGFLKSMLAGKQTSLRSGQTTGQVWKSHKLPTKGLKGYHSWLGNRLAARGCQIDGGGRTEVGGVSVRLFDPDKSAAAMKAGLHAECLEYVKYRQGQGRLELIGGSPVEPQKVGV